MNVNDVNITVVTIERVYYDYRLFIENDIADIAASCCDVHICTK